MKTITGCEEVRARSGAAAWSWTRRASRWLSGTVDPATFPSEFDSRSPRFQPFPTPVTKNQLQISRQALAYRRPCKMIFVVACPEANCMQCGSPKVRNAAMSTTSAHALVNHSQHRGGLQTHRETFPHLRPHGQTIRWIVSIRKQLEHPFAGISTPSQR